MFAIRRQKSDFDEVIERLDNQTYSANTWAGMSVTTQTAMQQATVYACVRILAETIASLPIIVQTRNADRRWYETDHDILAVLSRPNDWQTQHDLISQWVAWSELRGNAFAIKGLSRGHVRLLYPLQATGVDVEQLQDWSLTYTVSAENGFAGHFGPDQVFHLRNFGTDGYEGISTIAQLRNDIGLAQRAKEHGARVFMNGATAGRVIEADGVKSSEQALEMQRQFDQKYAGAQNSGKTPVMWGGSKLKEIGMNAQDAQMLETLKFQKQEIAGIFGVPLFLLNDTEKSTTWGTGLEQISKSFMRFSLRPRLNRLVSTMQRELLMRKEQATTRFVFDTDAFTLGSFEETMSAAEKAINNGILNPNEARDLINRNPRDGGDDYRQTPNSIPEGSIDEDETPDPSA